jgi:hypothetical protein
MTRGTRIAIANLVVGAALAVVLSGAKPLERKQLSFAEDDSQPVLVIGDSGAMVMQAVFLNVYASGTAELEHWSGQRLLKREPLRPLSFDEIEALLSLIVDGRLEKYDEAQLRGDVFKIYGYEDPAPPRDSSYFSVKFIVEETGDSQAQPAVITKQIIIQAPDVLARAFPSIPEYRALAALKSRFFQLSHPEGRKP